jgi:hypothetical protein
MNIDIKIPLYRTEIRFNISDNDADRKKSYKNWFGVKFDKKEDILPEESAGRVIASTAAWSFVMLRPDFKISDLVHESLHCTFEIARYVGLKHNSESEEAFTYLLTYIIDEFYKKYVVLKRKFENKAKIKPQEQLSIQDEGDTSN